MRLGGWQVCVEVLEAVPEFCVLHVVELVHAHFEVLDEDGLFGEECFGGELFELLVFYAFEEEVFFDVDE
jgi:hypothetical protein